MDTNELYAENRRLERELYEAKQRIADYKESLHGDGRNYEHLRRFLARRYPEALREFEGLTRATDDNY